jgi:hypothetical protein
VFLVELTNAQNNEHHLVLLLHERTDLLHELILVEKLGIKNLVRLQNPPTIHEQMRDDVKPLHARILDLNIKHPSLITNVIVET